MTQQILKEITEDQVQESKNPAKVGDGVCIHYKVREGNKERIQKFSGIVIAKSGSGIQETITVRRFAAGGIGVERVFPVQSPTVDKIEVERKSIVMNRAKLGYLRKRVGKAFKVKEARYASKY